MFRQLKKTRSFLRGAAPAASPTGDAPTGGGPGSSPSSDDSAGDESAFHAGSVQERAQALSEHHQQLADHYRAHAAPVAEEPESPAEAASETPADETAEGDIGGLDDLLGPEESPAEEAAESPAVETEEEDELARQKKGGGLRNANAKGKPLSRFAKMASGR